VIFSSLLPGPTRAVGSASGADHDRGRAALVGFAPS